MHVVKVTGLTPRERCYPILRFFLTYYPAVDEEKLIEEARSRFTVLNKIQTFTGGGMSKGLPLDIRDALQSQPTTHFCFWKSREFFRSIKREISCIRTDTNIERVHFGKGTMIFHLMRIRILNLNYADSDLDPTFLFDKESDTDPDILVGFLKS